MADGDGEKVRGYMDKLNHEGIYEVDEEIFVRIKDQFKAGYLSEDKVLDTIKECLLIPWLDNSKVKVLYKVSANPATSNPGPKLALVAGTLTFTFMSASYNASISDFIKLIISVLSIAFLCRISRSLIPANALGIGTPVFSFNLLIAL